MQTIALKQFAKRLTEIFPAFTREIAFHENNDLTTGKISQPQFLVLNYLYKNKSASMSDLAKVMRLRCSSMTGMIDRLIKNKLVKRIPHPTDRRIVQVEISAKGAQITREILRQREDSLAKLFAGLSAEERSTYLRILEKVFQDLLKTAGVILVLCTFGLGALWCGNAQSQSAEGVTLEECYQAGLKQSEVLGISAEEIVQTKEAFAQALGAILPEISAEVSTLKQGKPQRLTNFRSTEHAGYLTAHQPLFSGFKEFYGMRQAKSLEKAQTNDFREGKLALYRSIAETFYQILAAEKEVGDIAEESDLFTERIKDLNSRIRIGRSRKSEVLRVESSQANLKAQEEDLRTQIAVARETLHFLTGLDRDKILKDVEAVPQTVEPLENYLGGILDRPDVKAQADRVRASELAIGVERSGHFPNVGVDANYYLLHSDTLSDPNRDSMWDVRGSLSLPIFSGGITQAKIRAKQSEKRQVDLEMARIRRQAEQQVRSLHQTFISNQVRLQALNKATDLSKKNYEVQLQDYRLGLVNNLDVLLALSEYQENVRALHRFEFEIEKNYLLLQASVARKVNL